MSKIAGLLPKEPGKPLAAKQPSFLVTESDYLYHLVIRNDGLEIKPCVRFYF